MKYFYLFVLLAGITTHTHSERVELNSEQGIQIDCLVVADQSEEKGVIKKANGLAANTAYYIGCMSNEAPPMDVNDQFVKPVHKFGIEGRDAVPEEDNESRGAVILNRIQIVGNRLGRKIDKNGGLKFPLS